VQFEYLPMLGSIYDMGLRNGLFLESTQ